MGTPGAPNTSNHGWVCDSPSNRIEAVPAATRMRSSIRQPGRSSPDANDRRATRPSRGSPTSAVGASRPSSPNQTLNVSPLARHASRPNWAIIARVNAV